MALLMFCTNKQCLHQLDGENFCAQCGFMGIGLTLQEKIPFEVKLLQKRRRKLLKLADDLHYQINGLEDSILDVNFYRKSS